MTKSGLAFRMYSADSCGYPPAAAAPLAESAMLFMPSRPSSLPTNVADVTEK